MQEMKILIGGIVLIYCGLLVAAAVFQRNLLYHPDTRHIAPQTAGLSGFQEISLAREGNVSVVGWYRAAEGEQCTVLYFHGNGGGLANRAGRIDAFAKLGFGVLIMSYRGYSGSGGRPRETENVSDAKAAYAWLRAAGVTAEQIVLYGESLGTGVAVQVAMEKPVAGMVLEAPFTSIPDVAQRHYWYMPVRPFILDRYETIKHIKTVRVPLLVLHGARDAVTDVAFGRAVYEAANAPKTLKVFPSAEHGNIYAFSALSVVQKWIAQLSTDGSDGSHGGPNCVP